MRLIHAGHPRESAAVGPADVDVASDRVRDTTSIRRPGQVTGSLVAHRTLAVHQRTRRRRYQQLGIAAESWYHVDGSIGLEAESGAVGRPAGPVLVAAQVFGYGNGATAGELMHIDPEPPARTGGEGEELSVGRERRMHFDPGLRREPADPSDAKGRRGSGAVERGGSRQCDAGETGRT